MGNSLESIEIEKTEQDREGAGQAQDNRVLVQFDAVNDQVDELRRTDEQDGME